MLKTSIITFNDLSSTGINTISIGSIIHIPNTDSKLYELIDVSSLFDTTTIQDALDNQKLKLITASASTEITSETFIANSGQTVFNSVLDLSNPLIFAYGTLQNKTNYTISGQLITFNSPLETGVEMTVKS